MLSSDGCCPFGGYVSRRMAYLPNVQDCRNGCRAKIYFDRNSAVSHPSADRWIPLQYNNDSGVYTGEPHNCPKRSYGNGGSRQQYQQTQQQQPPQQQASTTIVTEGTLLKVVNAKLDRVINLLETLTTFVTAARELDDEEQRQKREQKEQK
jgi:hypothetical protein